MQPLVASQKGRELAKPLVVTMNLLNNRWLLLKKGRELAQPLAATLNWLSICATAGCRRKGICATAGCHYELEEYLRNRKLLNNRWLLLRKVENLHNRWLLH